MSEYAGPMELANEEIREAIDRFAANRLGSRRLPALLERTDAMLTELEMLNLMEVRRTPSSLVSRCLRWLRTCRSNTRRASDRARNPRP